MNSSKFWKNKKVLVTGHTGFKGSWLCTWLTEMDADVFGYALDPETSPNMFTSLQLNKILTEKRADIRDLNTFKTYFDEISPEIVFHLAAQPLVRKSYSTPIETYETNIMGTAHVLEAIRCAKKRTVRSVVIVTTDKCYENKEWCWSYRENEPLGGHDPYSSSKAGAELVVSSYRSSYFNPKDYAQHGVGLATARAGNVIGGGDWSQDRLIPDIITFLQKNQSVQIRNPQAIRPWQHVLEPLNGYLTLAQKLYETGPGFAQAFNFGPYEQDAREVLWITQKICNLWAKKEAWKLDESKSHLHEAHYLKLDISKAKSLLAWNPRWNLDTAIEKTVEWYKAYYGGENMFELSLQQINEYLMQLEK